MLVIQVMSLNLKFGQEVWCMACVGLTQHVILCNPNQPHSNTKSWVLNFALRTLLFYFLKDVRRTQQASTQQITHQ